VTLRGRFAASARTLIRRPRHHSFKDALDKLALIRLPPGKAMTATRAVPMLRAGDVLNGWLALLLAGLLEIAWALGLKYSEGLTRFWPSVAMLMAIAASFALLAVALKSIPFGTAYALWTGIGAAGTVIVGMMAFGEPADVFRVTCLTMIIAGMVGLKLASAH
jgi:quaternary ammonium compound-resistance protein SugE